MATSTTHPPSAAAQDQAPPDIETMRATARRLLGPDDSPDALPPAPEDVETLIGAMRGQLELLGPEVEQAAGRLHKESIPRYCALACVGEARGKLKAQATPGSYGAVAYARRLARVLGALCDHYERLGDARP